eukprot:TRINITY_DN3819_c0_g1_i1.p1 TRINITY_DN3819_c0_g1~~TRINITY_DN3819_c0_g1_i1.p1  ORF type:complete len:572 (+),score=131.76 TRINITY_DN3819_c0_g1_i1:510-2225(+)
MIFAVVYEHVLQLLYVEDFLKVAVEDFRKLYNQSGKPALFDFYKMINHGPDKKYLQLQEKYKKLQRECEEKYRYGSTNKVPQPRVMEHHQTFEPTDSQDGSSTGNQTASVSSADESASESDTTPKTKSLSLEDFLQPNDPVKEQGQSVNTGDAIKALAAKGVGPRGKDTTRSAPKGKPAPPVPLASAKSAKGSRTWSDKVSSKDAKSLDLSGGPGNDSKKIEDSRSNLGVGKKVDLGEESDYSEELEKIRNQEEAADKPAGTSTRLFSWLKAVTGTKPLERVDLEVPLEKLKEHLVTKNVAEEIAGKICDSVLLNLIGKTLPSFTGVEVTVKQAMYQSLSRILTPSKSIDVLRQVQEARAQGRPYTIVFCGVNGVGKSTNLAKVCKWLLDQNLSVMFAACDTFRSGAVEQLRTHARCLEVDIYEQGYAKDPSAVATAAVNFARMNRKDVVLIDTAGRMQDNEPLMRALAKLVHENNPDLVTFVGEALVGNDGVDQLVKFNKAMGDFSPVSQNPRLIDGILLTKFDTIDDKVGAAISMVYATGQPILFVGTGQTYTDLKKLNVKSVVEALLQ